MFTIRANSALFAYVLIVLIAFIASCWFPFADIRSIFEAIEGIFLGRMLLFITQVFFLLHLSIFIWRIVLFFKYTPSPPCDDRDLPECSVIVPAYNEGRQVLETIRSIAGSDYPPEKMSIVAIDDGSRDDTWRWLKKASDEFPDRVTLFRQPENRGKRHALYLGFKHGKGDVFVTIDSDSTVAPRTLRHLVSPFVLDRRVGAVAGNVRILNRQEGSIPKMLEVAFAFSFDFLRAGQSVINSVMCTPGALSAYRRDVVLKVLFEWVNQKFCGRAANIGEDRAMTNLILKSGCHVHYQREAIVYTTSPTTFLKLWKMLLRWARSNVRETLVITRFVFRRFREGGSTGLRVNVMVGWMNMTLGQILHLCLVALLVCIPGVVFPKMLMGAALASCAPGIFYASRYHSNHAVWAIPYSYLWMSCLSWIGLYALISPHKTGWMTRNLKPNHMARHVPESTPPGKTLSPSPKIRMRKVA